MPKLSKVLYSAKSTIVGRLRFGDRTILWTMDHGLGFGNHLYLWLHAHIEQQVGRDYRVLVTDAQRPWLARFPDLEPLTIEREHARFQDQREWGVTPRLYQRFGVDYTRRQLHDFTRERMSDQLGRPATEGTLVINVRRGDYYTTYRDQYGMNLTGYLHAAVDTIGPVDHAIGGLGRPAVVPGSSQGQDP